MKLRHAAQLLFLFSAVELLSQPSASAQMPPPPPGMEQSSPSIDIRKYDAGRELARLTKRYKLTGDEAAKIRPILAEQEKQIHALGEDNSLSDKEWIAAVRRAHREAVMKIKTVMTDAQASHYIKDEDKQAKDDEQQEPFGPPDGPPPGLGPPPGGGPPGGGPPGA